MPGTYFHHLFGPTARALQERAGSRASYARREDPSPDAREALGERELAFLAARDSVYLASVTAEGWPYVQHRGGPPGFVRALGENRIGFADYPGNRQFISLGNVIEGGSEGGRVALFAMDYPARRRLKLIGHARVAAAADEPELVGRASHPDAPPAAAAVLIDVVGYDWNCPQYITPRFTREEIAAAIGPEVSARVAAGVAAGVAREVEREVEREVGPLREENARLRAELARAREATA